MKKEAKNRLLNIFEVLGHPGTFLDPNHSALIIMPPKVALMMTRSLDKLLQCHDLFPSSVALIFHHALVLVMEELDHCVKPHGSSMCLSSGLCGGQSMSENDVSCFLNRSFTVCAR